MNLRRWFGAALVTVLWWSPAEIVGGRQDPPSSATVLWQFEAGG